MKNINSYRKFSRNDKAINNDGEYVLYWMQINRRLHYNYALEFAIAWANKLGKPLLIYEGLNANYPWASDRFHAFIMQGMKANLQEAEQLKVNLFSYVEAEERSGKGLIYSLAENACCVISDEYPVFIIKEHNEKVGQKLKVPYITIDSNGIIPLGITDKDPYSAYLFRKIMQKHFLEAFTNPPRKDPLSELENTSEVKLSEGFLKKYPSAKDQLNDIENTISMMDIDHDVKPLDIEGTREAALEQLDHFIEHDLMDYGDRRNHPDENKVSGMSPWLHFGKISEYEIVKAALEKQPSGWDIASVKPNNGARNGFFGGHESIESFLDEVITWREVGFHFAHHRDDYDQYESLPDWVLKSLEEHKDDVRDYTYSLDQLEYSQTHDELWNAAQTQLREEGIIHNYLRMLWGKKVIEWTSDHRTALEYLIHLNNKYAIDGRDPNSYSGIFWCFGRFDRPWQERKIFGKLRYMTSNSTRSKVKLKQYLTKFGSQSQLFE